MDYIALLKKEVVPALGCTEPIAVAYAAAWAHKTLGFDVERLEVLGSRNILKNAMSVGIPGSDMSGLPIAAALGALAGRTDAGLEVLCDITPQDAANGRRMIDEGRITVKQQPDSEPLYIEVRAFGGGHSATAIIQRSHTLITDLILDGVSVKHEELSSQNKESGEAAELSVHAIYRFCETVPIHELAFLKDGIEMNLAIAQEGLSGKYGMSVGYHIASSGQTSHILGADIGNCAVSTTAAACDARMAGIKLPVMSVAGSGNQGLVCLLPVTVFAQKSGVNEETLLRAVALSALMTVHIKHSVGRLSALCGCGIAAAVGASCGILYVLGGKENQVDYTVKNMVANITGMVCDGAKSGCAVKVATSVSAAVQCAVLAINNVHAPDIDGIVDKDVEKTIDNLGSVGRDGMSKTDQLILDLMTSKASGI